VRVNEEVGEYLFGIGDVSSIFFWVCRDSEDAKIKCPKCGAVFTVDEGVAEIQKKGY